MILLTAFRGDTNSSARLLGDLRVSTNAHKLLLANSYAACGRQITDAIRNLNPSHILSFGLKPDADCLYIETSARRWDERLVSGFDIAGLAARLGNAGIACRISSDAGSYLCNHVYFAGLDLIGRADSGAKMIFIHVPAMRRFGDFGKTLLFFEEFIPALIR